MGPYRAKKDPKNQNKSIKNQQKLRPNSLTKPSQATLCYATMLSGRKSDFRTGSWPDCYRESTEIGPPSGLRLAEGRCRCFPGSSPAKIWPGSPISDPETLLRNIKYRSHRKSSTFNPPSKPGQRVDSVTDTVTRFKREPHRKMSPNPINLYGLGLVGVTKPYKFIRFGVMDVTKPCKCIGSMDESGSLGGGSRPKGGIL